MRDLIGGAQGRRGDGTQGEEDGGREVNHGSEKRRKGESENSERR